ncbi:hypothetical protein BDV98DRAFT_398893 [Pterulicium gracile]|uniref:Uncharacterized protein n=1 Tax=Pterulicium gracile TaxID=1884261 RepID=A0A5C3QPI5_9AGAR|nr:hypothetical protein BDV98DRAFT_398893 [Pterula gracilis]
MGYEAHPIANFKEEHLHDFGLTVWTVTGLVEKARTMDTAIRGPHVFPTKSPTFEKRTSGSPRFNTARRSSYWTSSSPRFVASPLHSIAIGRFSSRICLVASSVSVKSSQTVNPSTIQFSRVWTPIRLS